MNGGAWWGRVSLAFVALIAFGCLVLMSRCASAHSWYDDACCNEGDCRQTTLGEVVRHDDGWYVVPTKELIPFGDKRIKRSQDPLIHRCLFKTAVINYQGEGDKRPGDTRCLYIPEPAS